MPASGFLARDQGGGLVSNAWLWAAVRRTVSGCGWPFRPEAGSCVHSHSRRLAHQVTRRAPQKPPYLHLARRGSAGSRRPARERPTPRAVVPSDDERCRAVRTLNLSDLAVPLGGADRVPTNAYPITDGRTHRDLLVMSSTILTLNARRHQTAATCRCPGRSWVRDPHGATSSPHPRCSCTGRAVGWL